MLSVETLGNSFMSNMSFDQKIVGSRHSTGSTDQVVLDDDLDNSVSVKFV